ncbi:MAG TPA: twin-arginine translocase subunit TatC [Candidatus Dormibacteraeota bacterium]|nr:twin-arginine translocase subunit TatC [Candidatus Dormibacteraeota bacterium]
MAGEDRRMTVIEHLEELRRVLIVSLGAWLAATVLAFIFSRPIISFLERPIRQVLSGSQYTTKTPIVTSVLDPISIPFKVAAIVGFLAALPIILWQFWGFVSPGLRPVERRFAVPFIGSSIALFSLGAAFAYLVMPLGLGFILGFLGDQATILPDLNSYLMFFVVLIAVFGTTFELPVVLVLLGLLGITSSRGLRRKRRGAYVAIIGTAILITPGADPFTPTALAIPLLVFYEASILVLDKVLKR